MILAIKKKKIRKLLIIMNERILAGEQSRYSGMQCKGIWPLQSWQIPPHSSETALFRVEI